MTIASSAVLAAKTPDDPGTVALLSFGITGVAILGFFLFVAGWWGFVCRQQNLLLEKNKQDLNLHEEWFLEAMKYSTGAASKTNLVNIAAIISDSKILRATAALEASKGAFAVLQIGKAFIQSSIIRKHILLVLILLLSAATLAGSIGI